MLALGPMSWCAQLISRGCWREHEPGDQAPVCTPEGPPKRAAAGSMLSLDSRAQYAQLLRRGHASSCEQGLLQHLQGVALSGGLHGGRASCSEEGVRGAKHIEGPAVALGNYLADISCCITGTLLRALGLSPAAVQTAWGCRICHAECCRRPVWR